MFRLFFTVTIISFLSACYGEPNEPKITDNTAVKEQLIESNKKLLKNELETIANYIKTNNLAMERTESGLWYKIEKQSEGKLITLGNKVTYAFKLSLLTGELLYASTEVPKTVIAGKGGVESGLEEGFLMLNKGSKATFILPPHLAHGIAGDNKKIPQRAIIIYEIEILDVQ